MTLSFSKSRVLLVDDHPVVRAGLKAVIEREPTLEICGEAGTARQARGLVQTLQPELAVVDLMLKDEDGLALVRELLNLHSGLQVLVVSMLDEKIYAERALRAGAAAYLNKETGLDAVGPLLRQLATNPGARTVGSVLRRTGVTGQGVRDGVAALSDRELQVFQLIGLSRTTKEIAAALGISLKTAETHRENIKTKLHLPNGTALIARATLYARERGLILQ